MNIFQKIKNRIAFYYLNKEFNRRKQNKKFYNFQTAKSIGIIFSANTQEGYKITMDFIKFLNLQNINVSALGYVDTNEAISYFSIKKDISIFSLKKTNWYGKPKGNSIDDFIEKPFDIMINLCISDIYALHYILAGSNARLKISIEFPTFNYADFRIKYTKKFTQINYINEIKHYLNTIK